MDFTKGVNYVRVIPMAGSAAYVLHTFNWGHHRPSIQSSAGDCVERISYRQNPRSERNDISPKTHWVACSIPSLVMVPHKRRNLLQCGVLGNHVRADVGVPPHD